MYYIQPFYSIMNNSESKVDDQVKEYTNNRVHLQEGGGRPKSLCFSSTWADNKQVPFWWCAERSSVTPDYSLVVEFTCTDKNKWVIVLIFKFISCYRICDRGCVLYISKQKCAFNTLASTHATWLRRLSDTGYIDTWAVRGLDL